MKDPLRLLEDLDRDVERAGRDEMKTMFDSNTHPKPHKIEDEPIHDGCSICDIVDDNPNPGFELL